MTVIISSVLAWVIVGMLTGAFATQYLTSRGYGQAGDIGIGILGGLAAGGIVSLFCLQGEPALLASTAAAAVGAVLLTRLARALQSQPSA